MARLHYNKRIPIIKNLLYLNFSTGRGWSLSFGPPGAKVNYGINDHKKQVSFGKGGFRYRKTLSNGRSAAQTEAYVNRRPPEEKIDHMISKYVKKHYDLTTCTMQSFNFEASAWPHGIQITQQDGRKEMVYWDYNVNIISVYNF
ncbi:MAG: hypothetical protein K0S25_645 [Bacillus sp. (in: firmicutes)]|jgi:hypothetical protein|nr:hypothetical protein [Bacillus sp. (in: firmicutes)]